MLGRALIFAALRLVWWLYHSSWYQFFGNDGVTGESRIFLTGLLLMRKGWLPLCVVSFEFQALFPIELSASKRIGILGVSQKCSQHWSSLSTETSESKRGEFIPPFSDCLRIWRIFSRWHALIVGSERNWARGYSWSSTRGWYLSHSLLTSYMPKKNYVKPSFLAFCFSCCCAVHSSGVISYTTFGSKLKTYSCLLEIALDGN